MNKDVIDAQARKGVNSTPMTGPAMYQYLNIKRAKNEHPSGIYSV